MDSRSFIRHPSEIPIHVQQEELAEQESDGLKDISHGGLAFHASHALDINTTIRIHIPLLKPPFEALGRVIWCRPGRGSFEIGMVFLEKADAFRARMVEQVCKIEQYKQEMLVTEGRKLNSEQAAMEWIAKFADEFPAIND